MTVHVHKFGHAAVGILFRIYPPSSLLKHFLRPFLSLSSGTQLVTSKLVCHTGTYLKLVITETNLMVVIRMNETRSVKKIFEGKLEGRRGKGRPILRWINDVEDDLRKLGVKR